MNKNKIKEIVERKLGSSELNESSDSWDIPFRKWKPKDIVKASKHYNDFTIKELKDCFYLAFSAQKKSHLFAIVLQEEDNFEVHVLGVELNPSGLGTSFDSRYANKTEVFDNIKDAVAYAKTIRL